MAPKRNALRYAVILCVVCVAALLALPFTFLAASPTVFEESVTSLGQVGTVAPTEEEGEPIAPSSPRGDKVQLEPYRLQGGYFEVLRNTTVTPPEYYRSAEMQREHFVFDESIRRVFIEVGVNEEPEMRTLLPIHPDAALIGFEPQPPVFTVTAKTMSRFPRKQYMLFPNAIAPSTGTMDMFISAHKGCSSLLQMNDKARAFAKAQGKKAPRKSSVIQLRTLEFCARLDEDSARTTVPTFPLAVVLDRIPPSISIDILMIDAQGFDTFVASTIGLHNARRIRFLVLECQDLEVGHQLFLVGGAPNCHQQRACVEAVLPHRLDFCWDNAPKVREFNCMYRLDTVPEGSYPKGLKIVSQPRNISYVGPARTPYQCPTFIP